MRIWLEKGKQKELLQKEKELRNLGWKELAEALGVNASRLNSWVYEENLITEEIFNKLRLNIEYKRFIIRRLIEGWGQIKGGKLSPGNLKEIRIPEKSKALSEFFGLMLGDGHVQKIEGYKRGTYGIVITGHSLLDKDYLLNFVKPLGEKLFGIKSRILFLKKSRALQIIFDSRAIADFFEKEGFKSGNKLVNQVTIPDWITKNPNYLAACLRGLFDTDGSFYRLGKQNSYQINFKNFDKTLLRDVRESLIKLGIAPSKISKNIQFYITKKQEIAKFYKVVGFHNPKHLIKMNAYFKAL